MKKSRPFSLHGGSQLFRWYVSPSYPSSYGLTNAQYEARHDSHVTWMPHSQVLNALRSSLMAKYRSELASTLSASGILRNLLICFAIFDTGVLALECCFSSLTSDAVYGLLACGCFSFVILIQIELIHGALAVSYFEDKAARSAPSSAASQQLANDFENRLMLVRRPVAVVL